MSDRSELGEGSRGDLNENVALTSKGRLVANFATLATRDKTQGKLAFSCGGGNIPCSEGLNTD